MSDYFNVADIFGENVFNDTVMQERLPKKVYKKLHEVMDEGKELDLETADVIAHEMKEWAIEKGATHLLSHQADFVRPLRQEDIQHGIVHHLLSFVRTQQEPLFVFQLLSVLTQERHWIRRHHFFVPWKQSIHSLSVC